MFSFIKVEDKFWLSRIQLDFCFLNMFHLLSKSIQF